MAEAIAAGMGVYAGAGLVFAVLFVARGVDRVDPIAKGSGAAFRLMILPGAVTFWPLLLARWIRRVS